MLVEEMGGGEDAHDKSAEVPVNRPLWHWGKPIGGGEGDIFVFFCSLHYWFFGVDVHV